MAAIFIDNKFEIYFYESYCIWIQILLQILSNDPADNMRLAIKWTNEEVSWRPFNVYMNKAPVGSKFVMNQ